MDTTRRSLLLRLRADDCDEAWNEFHAIYAPLVRRVARRFLGPADQEDVLQDVLLALTGKFESFEYDPTRGRFRGYLKTIASRAVQKKLRQIAAADGNRPLDPCTEPIVDDQDWDAEWRRHHLNRALAQVEANCSTRDRDAFRAHAIGGQPAGEVAERFGISLEQLYQIKSRLLRRVGAQVEAQIRAEDGDDG